MHTAQNGSKVANDYGQAHKERPHLSVEDRLTLENLYLKIENYRLQQEMMTRDLTQSVELRRKLQLEMAELQVRLTGKYGVELQNVIIHDDGTIVPTTQGVGK